MGNWIEEAEKRQKENNISFVQGSNPKNEIVKSNLEKISGFIENLTNLVERVSRISPEERKPSLEVGTTHLEGEVKYEFYGSAFQMHQKSFALIFKKTRRYIFWRRFYIQVTDSPDIIKITLYEKGTNEMNYNDVIKKKQKFLVKINAFQPALCYVIVDWIVYKISSHEVRRHLPSVSSK